MLVPRRQSEGHSVSKSRQFRVPTVNFAPNMQNPYQTNEYHPAGKSLPPHGVYPQLALAENHDLCSNTWAIRASTIASAPHSRGGSPVGRYAARIPCSWPQHG
jgi:hypothetical protein